MKEQLQYKISSRATILLGRESVSKTEGALIELVKNTYDADATACFLCFDVAHDRIMIIDNGCGMTQSTIEEYWMLIGTDNKRKNAYSPKGRVKSGEKGIGRFALDRLGTSCQMYTKSELSDTVLHWSTDWSQFEEEGKLLDEMSASIETISKAFEHCLPSNVHKAIKKFSLMHQIEVPLETGTVFLIGGLRDKWTAKQLESIWDSMGYLTPPFSNNGFCIAMQENALCDLVLIEDEMAEDYDYCLHAKFDGQVFSIVIDRNEFDLDRIPMDVWKQERFQKFPYRFEDFREGSYTSELTIEKLLGAKKEELIENVMNIGPFQFDYVFAKLSMGEDSRDILFAKEISKLRSQWMKSHAGVKIYRDNFLVRPYGQADGIFDWLGLDARKSKNPTAVSSAGENWAVRNAQGYGRVYISRVDNADIADKSSREGLIDNAAYHTLQQVLIALISYFERDRAYVARTLRLYNDMINEKDETKKKGASIAQAYLDSYSQDRNQEERKPDEKSEQAKAEEDDKRTLAETVQYLQEEREELVSEISLLRSLATNGLLTSTIVHDLKSLTAQLVNRVDKLGQAIEKNNSALTDRLLRSFESNDQFLEAWITVISSQTRADKRRRKKRDLYSVVQEAVEMIQPVLARKQMSIQINTDGGKFERKVFSIDLDSIIYNLIINSMDALEQSDIEERKITITLETSDAFYVTYHDNGKGLEDSFQDPYDIFKFGTTSKVNASGEKIGTGMGMYIVASTLREYNSTAKLLCWKDCFELQFALAK